MNSSGGGGERGGGEIVSSKEVEGRFLTGPQDEVSRDAVTAVRSLSV